MKSENFRKGSGSCGKETARLGNMNGNSSPAGVPPAAWSGERVLRTMQPEGSRRAPSGHGYATRVVEPAATDDVMAGTIPSGGSTKSQVWLEYIESISDFMAFNHFSKSMPNIALL
uniref:Uncharacterized protein n=1 Tax=Ananas comosus var. bracteatus TaxID=296719 RepID=A0A6V7PSB1_ANACO|nr:unnamed protein product [Ananas comosus var. bracteatus]